MDTYSKKVDEVLAAYNEESKAAQMWRVVSQNRLDICSYQLVEIKAFCNSVLNLELDEDGNGLFPYDIVLPTLETQSAEAIMTASVLLHEIALPQILKILTDLRDIKKKVSQAHRDVTLSLPTVRPEHDLDAFGSIEEHFGHVIDRARKLSMIHDQSLQEPPNIGSNSNSGAGMASSALDLTDSDEGSRGPPTQGQHARRNARPDKRTLKQRAKKNGPTAKEQQATAHRSPTPATQSDRNEDNSQSLVIRALKK